MRSSVSPTVRVLSVSLEELLGPPREAVRLYKAHEIAARKRGSATLRRMIPDATPGLDLDRMELPAGARMTGIAHRAGTREYLACEQEVLELSVPGQVFTLTTGDVVVFRGDQKHVYANRRAKPGVAYSLVILAPAG